MKPTVIDREQALKLYEMGLSDPEIADILLVDKQNVCYWRRRNGLPANRLPGGQKRTITTEKTPEEVETTCSYEHCNGCVYWDPGMNGCDWYFLKGVGNRRPCKAGKGCTVKELGKRKPARPADVWQNYRKEKHHAED